ncbi:uncharacterized protein LOC108040933 isoform X1 [Drosophila rhopaloa]|uniref:Uncharacterized protein n=1 Tax=Drosophila rhopaloa TaxID=1041015 RepID=A0ABM5H3Y8_DRORH|nr:uncharacterized protein LOC108040933 isoform X1 [Drosophila rhopaloa]
MNSCCCRSHSDRTDPMACLPQFPRLQRVQSCRPFLEGRKSASCCMSSERRWGQRNGVMVELLAKMVDKSANTVCQFLHQLTLQLFARILYPLMAGWNTLKIPFVLPDTCELYYGIFDECGNLRKPMPTRTFVILITILQYFLNLPTQRVCRGKNKCTACKNKDNMIKHLHNPGYCGKDAMTPFSGRRTTEKAPSPRSEVWAGLRRLGYERSGGLDLDSYPSDESIPYGYAPSRCPCQARDPAVARAQWSRRGTPSPYANIQDPMELESACERVLRSPMLAPECSQTSPVASLSPEAAQLYHITQISNLYTAVVENRHSRILLGSGKPPKQRVIPCTEKRFSGGFMMPEPYFNGMPWSWLHRDPQKMMRLPSGGLPLEIPRYRRQPLDEEYHSFRSRYEDMSRQVNPFKEGAPSPVDKYPTANRFTPEKSLQSISWKERTLDPKDQFFLPTSGRRIPVEEKKNMEWEELLLKRVNQPRKTQGALDYWKEMMERHQLKIDQARNNTLSIRSLMVEKNNSFPSSVRQTTERKLWIIKAYRNRGDSVAPQNRIKPINSERLIQKLKDSIGQDNESSEIKTRQARNKSVDDVLRLVKRDDENNGGHKYPDPEDYRKEMARNRRYQRKTAGESILLIKTAESIVRKRGFIKLNETKQPLTRQEDKSCLRKPLLKKMCIEHNKPIDKRVRFLFHKNPSLERVKPVENLKTKIRRTFFLPGGGDQLPKQYSKPHEGGPKIKKLSSANDDRKIIFKPRRGKSPEKITRKNPFHSDDSSKDKSQASNLNPQKKYHGNPKTKPNKCLERSCGLPSKIFDLTEVETLRRKRRKPLSSML